MPKHVVNVTSPPPPAASTPRLVASLFVVAGELLAVAVFVLGLVTLASWLTKPSAAPVDTTHERRSPPPWACWADRYGEHCDRPPHRHYARDVY
jgi:hypothetical protein